MKKKVDVEKLKEVEKELLKKALMFYRDGFLSLFSDRARFMIGHLFKEGLSVEETFNLVINELKRREFWDSSEDWEEVIKVLKENKMLFTGYWMYRNSPLKEEMKKDKLQIYTERYTEGVKKRTKTRQKPEKPFGEILKYGGIFGKVDKINPHPYLPDGDEEEEANDGD